MGDLLDGRYVPAVCEPGGESVVHVPLWNENTVVALNGGIPAILRVIVLDPEGKRLITHDVLLIPESLADSPEQEIPIGPDANVANF